MLLIFHLIRISLFGCVCGVPVFYILDINCVEVSMYVSCPVSVLKYMLHSSIENAEQIGNQMEIFYYVDRKGQNSETREQSCYFRIRFCSSAMLASSTNAQTTRHFCDSC